VKTNHSQIISLLAVIFILLSLQIPALAAPENIPIPSLRIDVGQAEGPEDVAVTLRLVLLLTILSLAPSLLILTTAFTRIVIVLSLLRNAIGTQQVPPNQVIIGLALFLTFFVMAPVWNDINTNAIQPYMNEEISFDVASQRALDPNSRLYEKPNKRNRFKTIP